MKKLTMIALGAAVAMFGASAMAQVQNPWTGDGAEVGVTIEVGAIGEVYSTIGSGQARQNNPNVVLEITNTGGFIPEEGIAEDTVNHFANVNYEVSVAIDGDIPEMSRFHVLVGVNNRGAYNSVFAGLPGQVDVDADTVVTWNRTGGVYGANAPGTPVPVLTGSPSVSANSTLVDYAADAIFGLPEVGSDDIEVIWTIAQD